jgi:hypothetical protein
VDFDKRWCKKINNILIFDLRRKIKGTERMEEKQHTYTNLQNNLTTLKSAGHNMEKIKRKGKGIDRKNNERKMKKLHKN